MEDFHSIEISPIFLSEQLRKEYFLDEENFILKSGFKELIDQDKLNELSLMLTDFRYDDEEGSSEINAYYKDELIIAWVEDNDTEKMLFDTPEFLLVSQDLSNKNMWSFE